MPKANDFFPGKYLKADDLKGAEPVVTISHIKNETLGDDLKPVLYFAGKERGLVLNRTNFSAIVDITGRDDSDDWAGCKVKLVTRRVEFQGKRVAAIRVEEPTGTARKPPAPPEREPGDEDDLDTSITF